MSNRPYQGGALKASRADWEAGHRKQLFVMATGTGKTHTFAQIAKQYPELTGQEIVLAHREELIDQAIEKIRLENPGKRVDKEKAEHHAEPALADVIVASVQSMTAKRMLKYNWTRVDKIQVDEAHHSTGDSYVNILDTAGYTTELGPHDQRLLTGWTATCNRRDGTPLATIYKKISYTYTIQDAIQDGWLVDIRAYCVRTDTSLDGVGLTAGDFNQKRLAEAVNTPSRNAQAYRAWAKMAPGLRTVGFTVDIKHAIDLAAYFQAKGVKATAVWGDDPDRSTKLKDFEAGVYDVIFNCGILTEGWDCWQVMCILLCAPTTSPVKYAQCVGRLTRLQKLDVDYNLKDRMGQGLKEWGVVIDMVDNCRRNSICLLPTLMGLPAGLDLQGQSAMAALKKLQEAQRDFPSIDLSQLPDISQLPEYIEAVNLFDIKFAPEVESNSEMSWHRSVTGGYIMLMPDKESITIEQNLLDKFVVETRLDGKKYRAERDTLPAAFAAADGLVIKMRPTVLKVLKRHEAWHDEPASDGQLNLLKRLHRGKPIPPNLTKGQASRAIGAVQARRV